MAFLACSQFLLEVASSDSGIQRDPWFKLIFPNGIKMMWILCPHCGGPQAFLGGYSDEKVPGLVDDFTLDGACAECGKPVIQTPMMEQIRGMVAYRDITEVDQILARDEEGKDFFIKLSEEDVD